MHRTHASRQHGPCNSRLIRLVVALGNPAANKPVADFAERLARLFDLSDTLVLDDVMRRAPAPAPDKETVPADGEHGDRVATRVTALQADLARTRDDLAEGIVEAFTADSINEPLPEPKASRKPGIPPAFEPYQRFYQARQRTVSIAVQRLRARVRRVVADGGTALDQLVALDEVFDATMANYARQSFAALPSVLEQRFRTLWRTDYKAHDGKNINPTDWLQPGAWLNRFQQEMRLLLLVELEVRLEPVEGLLAAVHDNEDNPPQ